MTLKIRPATISDAPALSRICLLTADAGKSAEQLHVLPELPGLVYSEPYVHFADIGTWAFVLVDRSDSDESGENSTEEVVGYTVGAIDTFAYEHKAEEVWWLPIREKYGHYRPNDGLEIDPNNTNLKAADIRYINIFFERRQSDPGLIAFSPAHLHINILPTCQRQGWGRRLIGHAIEHMRSLGVNGVWLGMDPRNVDAAKFYERVGFKPFEGAPAYYVGLQFDDWEK